MMQWQAPPPPEPWQPQQPLNKKQKKKQGGGGKGQQGKGQGKNQGGGKGQQGGGKGKGKKGDIQALDVGCAHKTPDGRLICYPFNSRKNGKGSCTKPNCMFAHVCGICFAEGVPLFACNH